MINDAYRGKFQLIITKEVSRFSRNILDTIAYTRELKSIGVAVLFMIDGINTMNSDAELHLSIMGSLAQEESRKISSRITWGQTRQMEKGVVFGHSLLGYDVKQGKITIDPPGAEIVRLIFRKYALEQVSTSEIARFLSLKGYHTYNGRTQWSANTVSKILHNEKYVGDLIQKKTYTPDFLTHEKRKNNGNVPLICIKDHHVPIISREIWNKTQERLQRSNKHTNAKGKSNFYIFSGKIKCGECGAFFVSRLKYLADGTKIRWWRCGTAARDGVKACNIGKNISNDDAMQSLKTALCCLDIDPSAIERNVTSIALTSLQAMVPNTATDIERIKQKIFRTQKKKESVLDSYFSGDLSKEEMQLLRQRYVQQLEELSQKLDLAYIKDNESNHSEEQKKAISSMVASILNGTTESEVFLKNILESLTVFKDRHMELRLKYLSLVFHFS